MIRKINQNDKAAYIEMAEEFYCSEAVDHKIPITYIEATFQELMRSDEYTEGYILECDGETAGYALLAKTFSQEAGGKVLWLEELYVLPKFQSRGLGTEWFAFMEETFHKNYRRFRLEVEDDNRAVNLYRRTEFEILEYVQMVRDFPMELQWENRNGKNQKN